MDDCKKQFDWKTVVMILMAGLLLFCLAKINRLTESIENLENRIAYHSSEMSVLGDKIKSIYDNVDEQLKKEASLLSSVEYTLGALDAETHTIPVTLKVVPKILTDDMQLSVQVGDASADFERIGNEFTATFPVNMFISFDNFPMLSIKTSDDLKTELMESVDLTNLHLRYLPNVYAYITPFDEFKNGKLTIDSTLQFDVKPTAVDSVETITKVELVTEKNEKEIARENITDKVEADFNHVPVNVAYDAKYGDEFCIYIVAEDSRGYIHKTLAYYWHMTDENTSEAVTAVGDNTQIYDKDGHLMTGNTG